jgi:hypothetical protein
VDSVVIAGEKEIVLTAWREKRRRQHMVEAHIPAAAEMVWPGGARSCQQGMKVVYSWCKKLAWLIHHRNARRVTGRDPLTRAPCRPGLNIGEFLIR